MRCMRSGFLLILRRPAGSILFPYTTLFRSGVVAPDVVGEEHREHARDRGDDRAAEDEGGGDLREVDQRLGGLPDVRSEEHTSELQSRRDIVCRLLLEKKKK